MDIEKLINEKIQQLQDLNKQMTKIAEKIGALQEEGKAIHGSALQLKGGIESLAELKAKEAAEKAAAEEKTKGLILRDKSLVAPDGKTVLVDVNATPAAPAAEAAPEAPKTETPAAVAPVAGPTDGEPHQEKAPITLEVQ